MVTSNVDLITSVTISGLFIKMGSQFWSSLHHLGYIHICILIYNMHYLCKNTLEHEMCISSPSNGSWSL